MPTCTAFTKNASPCTHNGHTNGLCGYHAPMVATPELQLKFTRAQARLRARWQATQGVVPVVVVPVAPPPPPPAPPRPPPICGHLKRDGRPCEALAAQNLNGKCVMHHAVVTRRGYQLTMATALAELRRMWAHGRTTAEIDEHIRGVLPSLPPNFRLTLWRQVDQMILANYFAQLRIVVLEEGDVAIATALIAAWGVDGEINPRRRGLLAAFAEALAQQIRPHVPAPIPANRREAQLAADTQNVHTSEISKQMKEAIDMLCAVEVPNTQKATVHEMRESWRRMGKTEAEIAIVYRDVSTWWNKNTVYTHDDRLYRRCMRGLWYTIKGYKGEVREELEKRMWDECRDACVPYSVCTQGHLARLSNVMVGFDDAFAQPVPVGEILQQKMAAIAGMDIESEKQVELAKALLEELKIPEEKHADWLAAF